MRTLQTIFKSSLVFVAFLLIQSCGNHNLFTAKGEKRVVNDLMELHADSIHRIQTDDKLSVSIWNHDDLSIGSLFGIYNSNEVYGKWVLVNEDGVVALPKIGLVNLGGLTTTEAAEKLQAPYSKFIKDPVIVVKVLNREVTILGEVATPGSYLLEKESNTLFEILGKAGGVNFYGDAKELRLIRNQKEYDIDLTLMSNFSKNNISLKAGDIIYVPTKNGKNLDKKAPTVIAAGSIVTTLVVILSLVSDK